MSSTITNTVHAVLFATDLSENTPVALSYAAGIASAYRAKLFLVHVLDPSDVTNAMDSSSSDLRNLAQTAKNDLKQISESLLTARGIAGQVLIRYGNVRNVIFQAQQEHSADMIVLGSSGKKIGHRKGIGSIAEAILRGMPCSVLTVGPKVEQRPFPTGLQAMLFPTDFSANSLTALPTAISLAAQLSAGLLLLHVCDPYRAPSCLGRETGCRGNLDKIGASVEKQAVPVEKFVRQGGITENILSLAKEKKVSFIVMGVHQGDLEDGTRLHDIVSAIAREAYCPLLTVAQQMRAQLP